MQGVRLLLDRAIPGGGWNLGNPVVFGTPLRPLPGPTGLALLALAMTAGRTTVPSNVLDPAIAYLQTALAETLAPASLGWGLLGLRAWGAEPAARLEMARFGVRPGRGRASPIRPSWRLLLLAAGPRSLEVLGLTDRRGGRTDMLESSKPDPNLPAGPSRRALLAGAGLLACGTASALAIRRGDEAGWRADVVVAKAGSYELDLARIIRDGLAELGLGPAWARGKSVLLKPNLVEPSKAAPHVNTHPAVVRAVAEVFRSWGVREVFVAEGQGHCRDTQYVLEQSGLGPVLDEAKLEFVDLNHDDVFSIENRLGFTDLRTLHLPVSLKRADLVVSLPKLKTHHWAGVTLAMKNLFGVMPGVAYGWPKNVLHHAGIPGSILDINAAVKPALAIVDGIVGMEGDGPIMGTPRPAGVLVMGTNLRASTPRPPGSWGSTPNRVLLPGGSLRPARADRRGAHPSERRTNRPPDQSVRDSRSSEPRVSPREMTDPRNDHPEDGERELI